MRRWEAVGLEGRWKAESVSVDGVLTPIGLEFEFKGNLLISKVVSTGQDFAYNRIVLDLSAKPRRMTATVILPPEAGKEDQSKNVDRSFCVYALDGDKLTMALRQGKDPKFPESLDGKDGFETIVVVMKRVKK